MKKNNKEMQILESVTNAESIGDTSIEQKIVDNEEYNSNEETSNVTNHNALISTMSELAKTNENDTLSDEELIAKVREKINNMNFEYPEGLIATLSQPVFHPKEKDILGNREKYNPIFAVSKVQEGDEIYKKVSLTYDGGFGDDSNHMEEIMNWLDVYNFKDTFFLTYDYMKHSPQQVIELINRGHEVGNHSTTHRRMNELTDEEIIEEILIPHYYVKKLTGVDMCLFRFPYGSYNNRSVELLTKLGYYGIQWSVDSLDWKGAPYDQVYAQIVTHKNLESGAIILSHLTASNTTQALPYLMVYLNDLGMKSIRVSDLIIKENFNSRYGYQSKKGLSR